MTGLVAVKFCVYASKPSSVNFTSSHLMTLSLQVMTAQWYDCVHMRCSATKVSFIHSTWLSRCRPTRDSEGLTISATKGSLLTNASRVNTIDGNHSYKVFNFNVQTTHSLFPMSLISAANLAITFGSPNSLRTTPGSRAFSSKNDLWLKSLLGSEHK